ncbi:unnamed protein product [Hermetia illucens]|uniref:Uncharacterized protein n=1 Tax=Hermetia illucens TaxID=343691 RepID=A0A7R8UV44_HERIL|nr:unnamed protein product [Hermetia illucens]
MENNYRPMSELDHYNSNLGGEEEYSDLLMADRAAVEAEMHRSDRAMEIRRDVRNLWFDYSDDEDKIPRTKRREAEKATTDEVEDAETIESIEYLENTKGSRHRNGFQY